MRGALEDLIGSVGLQVRTFASPQEFLHSERPQAPGCVVLDVGNYGARTWERIASGLPSLSLNAAIHSSVPSECR
jgi:FixJ family two-component response regulator